MKKLITIYLLLATAFTVSGQTKKPTKDETIAYLDKIVKMSIGYKTYAVGGDGNGEEHRVDEYLITSYSFNESKVEMTSNIKEYKTNISGIHVLGFSNLNWANVTAIKINSLTEVEFKLRNDSLFRDEELEEFAIRFSSKIMMKSGDKIYPRIDLILSVLKTKTESFKKAIERLVEITKEEENKDPFKN